MSTGQGLHAISVLCTAGKPVNTMDQEEDSFLVRTRDRWGPQAVTSVLGSAQPIRIRS